MPTLGLELVLNLKLLAAFGTYLTNCFMLGRYVRWDWTSLIYFQSVDVGEAVRLYERKSVGSGRWW